MGICKHKMHETFRIILRTACEHMVVISFPTVYAENMTRIYSIHIIVTQMHGMGMND